MYPKIYMKVHHYNIGNKKGIVRRTEKILTNNIFISEPNKSKKNWLYISTEKVLARDMKFVKSF